MQITRLPSACGSRAHVGSRPCALPRTQRSSIGFPVAAVAGAQVGDDACPVFEDSDGNMIQPMCADYGFRSGAGRLYMEHYGETPKGVVELAQENFQLELEQLRCYTRFGIGKDPREPTGALQKAALSIGTAVTGAFGQLDEALEKAGALPVLKPPATKGAFLTQEWEQIRVKLAELTLSNADVVKFEKARSAKDGELMTPMWVKVPFLALCLVLDVLYDGKPIQKFWVLETVARIPYFAYISILHLYESVGFWRAGAELRKIHFAEEWNEMHHLQIMESLGGDQSWFDRFVAEHSAIAYYWLLIFFYLVNPKLAYNFMQRVELHAMDTYAVFVEANRERLDALPPPTVALKYYLNEDLYLFDEFQQGNKASPRRPKCNTLLDVFCNIRDDEGEHVKTMDACQKDTLASALAKDKSDKKLM